MRVMYRLYSFYRRSGMSVLHSISRAWAGARTPSLPNRSTK